MISGSFLLNTQLRSNNYDGSAWRERRPLGGWQPEQKEDEEEEEEEEEEKDEEKFPDED